METLSNLLEAKAFWPLMVALLFYWGYCLLAAFVFQGAPLIRDRHARDYFITGRSLSFWTFIAAATATSFSGWTFISHPAVIYEFGFSAAFASFYAITIPLAGVFFLKRQWMLGKRCGFVTPGEMFYAYFKSDTMRYLVVVVAVLYSIFYLAIQLRATGYLFNILTDGKLSINYGIILLSIVLIIYVTVGGLRTVAYIDNMQAILLAIGIVALSMIVLHYVGGNDFIKGMERLANFHQYFHNRPQHFEIPLLISQSKQQALNDFGNYWTATFIFTFLFALMGNQSSPASTMWAFSAKDARAFGYQQVFASALGMGLIIIIFTAIIGVGGHFLGADYSLRENSSEIAAKNLLGVFINDEDLMTNKSIGKEALVPILIRMILDISPILIGLLALSALAAIQSTAASYMSTVGGILSRDLLKNGWCTKNKSESEKKTWWIFVGIIMLILWTAPVSNIDIFSFLIALSLLVPILIAIVFYHFTGNWGDNGQKWMAALFTIIITLTAIMVAIVSTETLVFMGALAVAYSVQMMPALIAICWWPFLTNWGIISGLIVGLIVVTLTELTNEVFPLAFGQWPLTIHSAAWGFVANLSVAIGLSTMQRIMGKDEGKEHRKNFHRFLNDPLLQYVQTPEKRNDRPYNWKIILSVVIIWALFAIGPLAMIGNSIFGISIDSKTWRFGIPSLWVWQILWWVIGVIMMYWLAFSKGLSMPSKEEEKIETLNVDISEANDKYCENIYSSTTLRGN